MLDLIHYTVHSTFDWLVSPIKSLSDTTLESQKLFPWKPVWLPLRPKGNWCAVFTFPPFIVWPSEAFVKTEQSPQGKALKVSAVNSAP